MMAAVGGSRASDRLSGSVQQKSSFASPEKVRELLSEGVLPADSRDNSLQAGLKDPPKSTTEKHCEATNKEAFFSRVESYSHCLRWAGKPRTLSPLRCARYGWINVGCDMLKCSTCQAFLCASLQPTLDFEKYESRIAEISRQLQTQHEKFCPWPDFPCPERFWLVPASEPSVLLTTFLERFQSVCLLEQQLPAMKPEQLKSMSLTEDVVSVVLQLVEEEQKKQGMTASAEPLAVQVAACIVALCGWAASPSLRAMNLPILTCAFCMRKVGLWNFHQMDAAVLSSEAVGEVFPAASPAVSPSPTQIAAASAAFTPEASSQADPRSTSASPTPSPSPSPGRMKLRSQDTTRTATTAQADGVLRARNRDSPSPSEELPTSPLPGPRGKRSATRDSPSPSEELAAATSPLPGPRGKRPATRSSRDGAASPQHTPKRLRLSSAGSPGTLHRNAFDPLTQHRDWCPWIMAESGGCSTVLQQGWKAVLNLLLPMKKSPNTSKQGPLDKSKRVFAIFRQWQVSVPSQ